MVLIQNSILLKLAIVVPSIYCISRLFYLYKRRKKIVEYNNVKFFESMKLTNPTFIHLLHILDDKFAN